MNVSSKRPSRSGPLQEASARSAPQRALRRLAVPLIGGLVLAGAYVALSEADEDAPNVVPELAATVRPAPVKKKRVADVIAEAQAAERAAAGLPAEPVKTQMAGISFEPFDSPPTSRLIQHPEFGEVIEITFQNGGVLYKPNLKRYSISKRQALPKEFE